MDHDRFDNHMYVILRLYWGLDVSEIALVRNPSYFADPDKFVPERWEGVSEHDVGTFGFGPRACIGEIYPWHCVFQPWSLTFEQGVDLLKRNLYPFLRLY